MAQQSLSGLSPRLYLRKTYCKQFPLLPTTPNLLHPQILNHYPNLPVQIPKKVNIKYSPEINCKAQPGMKVLLHKSTNLPNTPKL